MADPVPEMVERVARALAHVAGAKICGPGQSVATRELGWKPDGEHLTQYAERHWREHIHAAEFAIEAMRQPTPEMYEALCATDKMWNELTSNVVWTTYIDAALGKCQK